MDQRTFYQQSRNDGRIVLSDLSNNITLNNEKSSRLKEARLSFSRLTGSSLDSSSTNAPLQSAPSSYDHLEEKATPLKKRKRVNSVAILRRTKPRKDDDDGQEIALKSEIKNEPDDFYNAPIQSPILDYPHSYHFPKLMNTDRTPSSSSLGTINKGALYAGGGNSYKTYHIDNGSINMLDDVEDGVSSTTKNKYAENVSSNTFTEKDSIIDSDRSLTNITWLRQLGAPDTVDSHQHQTLISHFPPIVQPMVQRHQRPPYSYSALIQFAISSSSTGRMTLREIYLWIEDNFPFFRTAKPGWKNSIRHNLSLHKMFIRQPPPGPGKSAFWTLQPGTVVRLPSKRNMNSLNENPEQSPPDEHTHRNTYVNHRSGGTTTIGHQTKRPFLLPRPNPALMHMPVIWNPNTGTYSVMQTIPNNMMADSIPMPYAANGMVLDPQHNTPVINIAPKMNKPSVDARDRMLDSSHTWPMHIPQTGHLAADSGFETDTSGGRNLFEFASSSEMNYLPSDVTGPVGKREAETEGMMTVISTPVKDSSTTPSKGISATSTPAKLFSELDFLSPIRGVSNLRTCQGGLSPLEKYLMSPSRDMKNYKSPMLGSLREFGLPGFTPKKDNEMNVSVHNQSFEEIFGDMNISLDMAAAAADISWSAF